jgi:hypothetical protein
MKLSSDFPERFAQATMETEPYGDLAYGQALAHWRASGQDERAFFSYAEEEKPCPVLMEFRTELSAHFGLLILTSEEAKRRRSSAQQKVWDWGTN